MNDASSAGSVVGGWSDPQRGGDQGGHQGEQSEGDQPALTGSDVRRPSQASSGSGIRRRRRGADGLVRTILISTGCGGYSLSDRSSVSRHPRVR